MRILMESVHMQHQRIYLRLKYGSMAGRFRKKELLTDYQCFEIAERVGRRWTNSGCNWNRKCALKDAI